jgi:hypothetical protein
MHLSSYINYNYDDFLDYYEMVYLAGSGLTLYENRNKKDYIMLDFNFGEKREKDLASYFIFNPYLTLRLQLTQKISLRQQAYVFITKKTSLRHNNKHEEYIETNINFKIYDNVSLQLTSKYKKDFFLYVTSTINEYRERLTRSVKIGVRYRF